MWRTSINELRVGGRASGSLHDDGAFDAGIVGDGLCGNLQAAGERQAGTAQAVAGVLSAIPESPATKAVAPCDVLVPLADRDGRVVGFMCPAYHAAASEAVAPKGA